MQQEEVFVVAGGTDGEARRILVVGSGWRFTSGISYYTCRLSNALSQRHDVSVLLTRRLVPRWLYPGRRRVGRKVNDIDYSGPRRVAEVLDWYWGPNLRSVLSVLREARPQVVVLQWWTGAVLHSYLLLAWLARRAGASVVIEWHELQDTGEARIPGIRAYTSAGMRRLLGMADGHVVHSEFDLAALQRTYTLRGPVRVVPHGPYDHVKVPDAPSDAAPVAATPQPTEPGAEGLTTVLFFGIVRPYKGVEDLVAAFDALPAEVADRLRLVVVGETWEGWTAHREAIARSPRRDRIVVRDEYVPDAEVAQVFAQADLVALPYRRSSASGPLHLAMSAGVPVVVSDVGGLRAAAADYEGALFVRPQDPQDLVRGLLEGLELVGRRFTDPRSWDHTVSEFEALFAQVLDEAPVSSAPAAAESRR